MISFTRERLSLLVIGLCAVGAALWVGKLFAASRSVIFVLLSIAVGAALLCALGLHRLLQPSVRAAVAALCLSALPCAAAAFEFGGPRERVAASAVGAAGTAVMMLGFAILTLVRLHHSSSLPRGGRCSVFGVRVAFGIAAISISSIVVWLTGPPQTVALAVFGVLCVSGVGAALVMRHDHGNAFHLQTGAVALALAACAAAASAESTAWHRVLGASTLADVLMQSDGVQRMRVTALLLPLTSVALPFLIFVTHRGTLVSRARLGWIMVLPAACVGLPISHAHREAREAWTRLDSTLEGPTFRYASGGAVPDLVLPECEAPLSTRPVDVVVGSEEAYGRGTPLGPPVDLYPTYVQLYDLKRGTCVAYGPDACASNAHLSPLGSLSRRWRAAVTHPQEPGTLRVAIDRTVHTQVLKWLAADAVLEGIPQVALVVRRPDGRLGELLLRPYAWDSGHGHARSLEIRWSSQDVAIWGFDGTGSRLEAVQASPAVTLRERLDYELSRLVAFANPEIMLLIPLEIEELRHFAGVACQLATRGVPLLLATWPSRLNRGSGVEFADD